MRLRTHVIFTLCALLVTTAAPHHSARAARAHHTVLILGDSVVAVTRWWPASLRPLWKDNYDVINEAWGCQALLTAGCPGSGGLSAVQRLRSHSADQIDAIIVGTGYNDSNEMSIRTAMKEIVREAKSHGARIIWLTYHARDNVRIKSARFNKVLADEASRHPTVTVVDWNSYAARQDTWFRLGGVHLNAVGGLHLGRFLRKSLNELFARGNE